MIFICRDYAEKGHYRPRLPKIPFIVLQIMGADFYIFIIQTPLLCFPIISLRYKSYLALMDIYGYSRMPKYLNTARIYRGTYGYTFRKS